MSPNIKHRSVSHLLFVLRIVLTVGLFTSFALAQSEIQEKPKLKHFGSSLDRLRWDKEKQAAVETTKLAKTIEDVEDVVRVETRLISSDVLVADKQGRAITGLTKDDFVITEDGQPQPIGHFSVGSDPNVPKSIVLVIDYSGSEIPYIEKSVSAAKRLIDQLGPKDKMAIVTDDVKLLVDFTNNGKELRSALHEVLTSVRVRRWGKSYQFSALLAVARELISNEDIRPIIIFQTDGDEVGLLQPPIEGWDWGRRKDIKPYSLNDVLLALDKSRATVYTVIPNIRLIGVPQDEYPKRVEEMLDRLTMINWARRAPSFSRKKLQQMGEDFFLVMQQAAAKVATATGGWTAFLERPDQADEIYERILADVNSRYVIGYYYPAGKPRDGKRHQFSITVKGHPEYQIAGRKSYIAPEFSQ
jgi:VWFA-related protein